MNTVKVKLAYENTDFTREYSFDGVADSYLASVKSGIANINNMVAAAKAESTEDTSWYGMRGLFVSDDFDPANNIGYSKGIVEAKIITENITKIPLF